jgi:hypothetical protein
MLEEACGCSAHEIAVMKSFIPRVGKHAVSEKMIGADLAKRPIGKSVHIYRIFGVVEVNASSKNFAVQFRDKKISAVVVGNIFRETLELAVGNDVEALIA